MKIALVGGPYSQGAAATAAALALAAPDAAPGGGGIIVLDAAAVAGAAPAGVPAVPCIVIDGPLLPDGRYDYSPAVAELTRLLAGKPGAVAVDSLALPAILGDPHGARAAELPLALARVLYWDRDRPKVVVHFCLPHSLPHYLRAWSRYVAYAPDQGIVRGEDIGVGDTAARRVERHGAYAEERRRANSYRTRALGALGARLKFWKR